MVKKNIIILAWVLIVMAGFVLWSTAWAEEPKCIKSRYHKIVLNHIYNPDGSWRISYYNFYVHYYIDGKHWYLITDWRALNEKMVLIIKDEWDELYTLEWQEGDYKICVTTPIVEIINSPFDIEIEARDEVESFKAKYPEYQLPKVQATPPQELVAL